MKIIRRDAKKESKESCPPENSLFITTNLTKVHTFCNLPIGKANTLKHICLCRLKFQVLFCGSAEALLKGVFSSKNLK